METFWLVVLIASYGFFAIFYVGHSLMVNKNNAEAESEIMDWRHGTFSSSIGVTFTAQIPYEIFYTVHHLLSFFCTQSIAHTFDIKERNNIKQRPDISVGLSDLLYLR
jgi:hypothetical protein